MSAAVLVETFQPGVSVEQFIRRPAPFNTQVLLVALLHTLFCAILMQCRNTESHRACPSKLNSATKLVQGRLVSAHLHPIICAPIPFQTPHPESLTLI